MSLEDLIQTKVNWREQIARNQKRTRLVIALFILLYVGVGFLVDLLIYTESYGVSTAFASQQLLSFHTLPYATLTMGVIAAISIWVTYMLYDKIMLMGTDSWEVTEDNAKQLIEKQLLNVVEEMKIAAGLSYMPKVVIIEAAYMNAFATGYSEKSALVAITRGLLEKLDRRELMAVMAHELSHIRHLDIKLTLMVGVLSNIMLMVADMFFYRYLYVRRSKSSDKNNGLIIFVLLLRFLLPIITVLLTLFLSRTREFMADAGCVSLMRDNGPLASALMKIHNNYQAEANDDKEVHSETPFEDVRRAAYLYDPVKAGVSSMTGISSLFSTHPALEDRLAALGFKSKNKNSEK